MKYFLFFSLVCLVEVENVWGKSEMFAVAGRGYSKEQVRQSVEECAQELNLPSFEQIQFYYIFRVISSFYPGPKTDKLTCLFACSSRKLWNSRGITFYSGTLEQVDHIYNHPEWTPKVPREDIISKMESCYAKDPNECEFAKCLDVMKPPFSRLNVLPASAVLDLIYSKFPKMH